MKHKKIEKTILNIFRLLPIFCLLLFILYICLTGFTKVKANTYENANTENPIEETTTFTYPITYKNIINNFNIWDEEWEAGSYSGEPGDVPTKVFVDYWQGIRCKNPIPVTPNTDYYIGFANSLNIYIQTLFLDSNGVIISYATPSINRYTFTTPNNCVSILIRTNNGYGTTYNHDICINISVSWANGNYVPYGEDLIIYSSTDISSQNNIYKYSIVDSVSLYFNEYIFQYTDRLFNGSINTPFNVFANAITLNSESIFYIYVKFSYLYLLYIFLIDILYLLYNIIVFIPKWLITEFEKRT